MRILIDECLHRELGDELVGHEVTTVQEAGWAGFKNGQLLKTIPGNFETFITIDKRIESDARDTGGCCPDHRAGSVKSHPRFASPRA